VNFKRGPKQEVDDCVAAGDDARASRLNLLQKNVKATYLDNIWSVINWKKAEERLASA
jgi:hypothetical protein